jgi:hypothetical protein
LLWGQKPGFFSTLAEFSRCLPKETRFLAQGPAGQKPGFFSTIAEVSRCLPKETRFLAQGRAGQKPGFFSTIAEVSRCLPKETRFLAQGRESQKPGFFSTFALGFPLFAKRNPVSCIKRFPVFGTGVPTGGGRAGGHRHVLGAGAGVSAQVSVFSTGGTPI